MKKKESNGLHNGSSFTVLAFTGGRKVRRFNRFIWITCHLDSVDA